jgi:hypothetical protein
LRLSLNLIPFRGFLFFIFILILAGPVRAQTVPFTQVIIDNALAGDCKMVGDIDGDGQGTACQKQVVSTGGIHNGVVADIGNDGGISSAPTGPAIHRSGFGSTSSPRCPRFTCPS